MGIPFIELNGGVYNQGVTHGLRLSQAIADNLALYFYRFEHECGLLKDEALQRAGQYLEAIKNNHPRYYIGMQGIAHGSDADLVEIAMLNVRYEILYYQYALKGLADGCTSLVVDRSRSAEDQLILAQNWDWFPDIKCAIVRTVAPDGPSTLTFTEAGIFGGKIGINSDGVGLLVNGLISLADTWRTLNKPFHIRCYEILQQRHLRAALAVVTSEQRACSANFVIASAKHGALNVEAAPDAVEMFAPTDGFLVHTNHFLDPELLGVVEPAEERIHTLHRYSCMQGQFPDVGQVTVDTVKRWLSDHDGYPNSVCQHPDSSIPTAEQYATVASIILNLDECTLSVAAGTPCCAPFETYELMPQVVGAPLTGGYR